MRVEENPCHSCALALIETYNGDWDDYPERNIKCLAHLKIADRNDREENHGCGVGEDFEACGVIIEGDNQYNISHTVNQNNIFPDFVDAVAQLYKEDKVGKSLYEILERSKFPKYIEKVKQILMDLKNTDNSVLVDSILKGIEQYEDHEIELKTLKELQENCANVTLGTAFLDAFQKKRDK